MARSLPWPVASMDAWPTSNAAENLAAAILRHAADTPHRCALVSPLENDLRVDFGALAERVARLRNGLVRQGIEAGDRVLLLAPLTVDMIAIAIAVIAAGATLVT